MTFPKLSHAKLYFLLASTCIVGCKQTEEVVETNTHGFPKEVHAVISTNCVEANCHSDSGKEVAKLDLESWDSMIVGSDMLYDAIPFAGRNSHMFQHVNTDPALPQADPRMPLGRNELSLQDQRTILNWIDQGARNNEGTVPYAKVKARLVVSHQAGDVTVIDRNALRAIRLYKSDTTGYFSITAMPDNSGVLIPSVSAGMIEQISLSNSEQRPIQTGMIMSNALPYQVAVLPSMEKAYATDTRTGTKRMLRFDPRSMTPLSDLTSDSLGESKGLVLSPDGSTLYVVFRSEDAIGVLDTKTDTWKSFIPLINGLTLPIHQEYTSRYLASEITVTSDNSKLYVALWKANRVGVIDLAAGKLTDSILVGQQPTCVSVSPNGQEVWVSNEIANTVSVISTATNTVIATIKNVDEAPHSIAFSPDGKFAYVACERAKSMSGHMHGGVSGAAVYVVDASTHEIVDEIETLGVATGITILN